MIEQYKRDGYVVASVLHPGDVERVHDDMHFLARQQLRHLGYGRMEGMHKDLETLLDANRDRYIATLTLCAKLASLWELYLDREIRSLIYELGLTFPVFQSQPVLHVMSNRLKIPGGYQGFGPHQDWPTLQGSLDTVTVWIPFTEVGPDNFTMEVVPGSHLHGLLPATRDKHTFAVETEEDFVPIVAKPGDVVFMSAWTVHRSSLKGDGLRISASMRYENAAEPTFIERGYPFAHRRVVAENLITPDFPKADQVRRIFA